MSIGIPSFRIGLSKFRSLLALVLNVLSSAGTPYAASVIVLSSVGTAYTTTKSVLSSTDTAYAVV